MNIKNLIKAFSITAFVLLMLVSGVVIGYFISPYVTIGIMAFIIYLLVTSAVYVELEFGREDNES